MDRLLHVAAAATRGWRGLDRSALPLIILGWHS
jgi:hypothetical protein